jgi:hypothetical protein
MLRLILLDLTCREKGYVGSNANYYWQGIIRRSARAKILGVVSKGAGVNGEELQKKGERGIASKGE